MGQREFFLIDDDDAPFNKKTLVRVVPNKPGQWHEVYIDVFQGYVDEYRWRRDKHHNVKFDSFAKWLKRTHNITIVEVDWAFISIPHNPRCMCRFVREDRVYDDCPIHSDVRTSLIHNDYNALGVIPKTKDDD